MLNLLKGYKGSLIVNDTVFAGLDEALQAFKNYVGQLTITLNKEAKPQARATKTEAPKVEELGNEVYVIKVKQYMTKPASPEFDFQKKWNNNIPMPMRIMVGKKIKETKGMVYMELWGEILEEVNPLCMKCGRTLTNPVSQLFGIGPECGGHGYNNPFDTDEELKNAVAEVNNQLRETKWTGWVIKSAIEEIEVKQ